MFLKAKLIIALICLPLMTAAQEVQLIAERARGALSAASLLRELPDNAVPQDYVAAARADYRRLLTALYATGYYAGTISITINGVEAASMAPLDAPTRIDTVVITVDTGPRFTFGDIAITPLPPQTILSEDLGPRQPAQSDQIKSAVSAGLNTWRDLGYAKAAVSSQQVIARHGDNKVDVSVVLNPGPRLTFGALEPTGNRRVSDDRVREIAGLPEGQVYSPADIAAAERRLRRTGTFDSVALSEAETIGPDNTLAIEAALFEGKRRRFGFGLEMSSIEGLTVSSFWLHRNLFGGAERFRIDVEVSGIDGETGGTDYAVRGNLTRPATFGPDTDIFLRGEVSREDEPDYLLDKISTEVGVTHQVDDDLTVEVAVGLLTAREESDLGKREYTLLTLPLKATLDRRDVPTNAKTGYYLDIAATPFISLEGDVSGTRLFGDARAYQTFGEAARLTLAMRGQFGSVAGANVDTAPADFLFYSGGGGTVRGQPYKSLGIDSGTTTTGGTSFAGAQLEARFGVTEKLALVGFYDVGHVGDTAIPVENGDWHAGAGIGLRYETGIGPIRLDLGTQANGDNAGENLQVYIGIGQAF